MKAGQWAVRQKWAIVRLSSTPWSRSTSAALASARMRSIIERRPFARCGVRGSAQIRGRVEQLRPRRFPGSRAPSCRSKAQSRWRPGRARSRRPVARKRQLGRRRRPAFNAAAISQTWLAQPRTLLASCARFRQRRQRPAELDDIAIAVFPLVKVKFSTISSMVVMPSDTRRGCADGHKRSRRATEPARSSPIYAGYLNGRPAGPCLAARRQRNRRMPGRLHVGPGQRPFASRYGVDFGRHLSSRRSNFCSAWW